MIRSNGCTVWDDAGHAFLDVQMALGAVALGYGHPRVVAAVETAVREGAVGSLAPVLEGEMAERLISVIPGGEAVRFLKSGAEAVAAAVRAARVYTGHERVITCGYHGWLDWCQDVPGVPAAVLRLRREVAFNDPHMIERTIEEYGPVAAIVVEPVIDAWPNIGWLTALRAAATRAGAVLIFDEIKTGFRIAVGGAGERFGIVPDIAVLGKAMGNGFPIAAVVGSAAVMDAMTRTWVSSTLATEYVSLAAARAVMDAFHDVDVTTHLESVGKRLLAGLDQLAGAHTDVVDEVRGIPQMCYLAFRRDEIGARVASEAAARGVLFKRSAYNFISLAHSEATVDRVLERLDDALTATGHAC